MVLITRRAVVAAAGGTLAAASWPRKPRAQDLQDLSAALKPSDPPVAAPDIVFVDIMMPRLDGYQTCSLIKHNKVFRSIPVIMLSSKDGLFDRARGRIVGSEHYLTKPFTKDELLSAIESHVGR